MTLFSFHGWRPDRVGAFIEAVDLPSEAEARNAALRMMEEHLSCVAITIYDEGDREVAEVSRPEALGPGLILAIPPRLPAWLDPAISVIATNTAGRVAYWGGAAPALYGWTAAEAVGRDIMDLTPALQSRAMASDIMRVLQSGAAWQGEITLRGRDGIPFLAFVADFPVGALIKGDGLIVGASVAAERRRHIDRQFSMLGDAFASAFAPAPLST